MREEAGTEERKKTRAKKRRQEYKRGGRNRRQEKQEQITGDRSIRKEPGTADRKNKGKEEDTGA
jgi:hypothetical protein